MTVVLPAWDAWVYVLLFVALVFVGSVGYRAGGDVYELAKRWLRRSSR